MHDLVINDLLHMKVYSWNDKWTINDCICDSCHGRVSGINKICIS